MLRAVLVLLCCCSATVVRAKSCEPSNYICAGKCPSLPQGVQLPGRGICLQDSQSRGCVCWLKNPSSHLDTDFDCIATINGTQSQILCQTPAECFSPGPDAGCLIIPRCTCLLHDPSSPSSRFGHWRKIQAELHLKLRPQNYEENAVEKVGGDVREFSLKHLLFLLAFVIAPLLCWCLLNFFHEGKCRKKSPQPPEAQPMPTSRGSTVDNMNNDDTPSSVQIMTPCERAAIIRPDSIHATAPEEELVCSGELPQSLSKAESPPPYFESTDGGVTPEFGPPPSYEDAIRGSEPNVGQIWQTVYIVHAGRQEDV